MLKASRDDSRLYSAQLQAFDQLALAAQSGGSELLELVGAIRALFRCIGPGLCGSAVVRVHCQCVAQLDFLGLGESGAASSGGGGGHGSGDQGATNQLHNSSLKIVVSEKR